MTNKMAGMTLEQVEMVHLLKRRIVKLEAFLQTVIEADDTAEEIDDCDIWLETLADKARSLLEEKAE